VCHDLFICVPWLFWEHFICVSWLIHMCVMTLLEAPFFCLTQFWWVNNSSICVPWLIHTCAMTHSFVCHDSLICITCVLWLFREHLHFDSKDPDKWLWHIHTCAVTHYVCAMTFLETPLFRPTRFRLGIVTHSYVCHDSLWNSLLSSQKIPISDRDSCIRVPWLIHMCAMTLCEIPCFRFTRSR